MFGLVLFPRFSYDDLTEVDHLFGLLNDLKTISISTTFYFPCIQYLYLLRLFSIYHPILRVGINFCVASCSFINNFIIRFIEFSLLTPLNFAFRFSNIHKHANYACNLIVDSAPHYHIAQPSSVWRSTMSQIQVDRF